MESLAIDTAKFDRLVHYVISKVGDPSRFGAIKLNKILYFSEYENVRLTGRPIAGATYVKREFGPVPKEITESLERLKTSGLVSFEVVWQTHEESGEHYKRWIFSSHGSPDLSGFTKEELALVDSHLDDIVNNHTAGSISDKSHNKVWEYARDEEQIPWMAAYFVAIDPPTDLPLAPPPQLVAI